jgi:Fe-S cluster biogenesis protein NfuA
LSRGPYATRMAIEMIESFRENVESALNEVRRRLAEHGGGIDVVDTDAETGTVRVRFLGACIGCPLAAVTLESIVEESLASVPGVNAVIAVPDEPNGVPDAPKMTI